MVGKLSILIDEIGQLTSNRHNIAFDSTGRHYDQIGNYTNWWDDDTVKAFEERAQCFIDQYSNFTVPGPNPDSEPLHVNGRLTLGENIADAGGLAAAFYAWRKRDESHADQVLPGLEDFTKEQLFFISYSNWWCSKTTNEAAVQAIYTDPHAPKPARILVCPPPFFFLRCYSLIKFHIQYIGWHC